MDLCREHGISAATSYGWKSKYGGMEVGEAQRLEDENQRLKHLACLLDWALTKPIRQPLGETTFNEEPQSLVTSPEG